MTDPIADMLTRIRNAMLAKHERVDIPASRIKSEVGLILKKEGFVRNFKIIKDGKQGILRIYLKYQDEETSAIQGIRRVSTPGSRYYARWKDIPRVLDGLGIAIVSTSRGIMTDKDCRAGKIGGEVLCYVW